LADLGGYEKSALEDKHLGCVNHRITYVQRPLRYRYLAMHLIEFVQSRELAKKRTPPEGEARRAAADLKRARRRAGYKDHDWDEEPRDEGSRAGVKKERSVCLSESPGNLTQAASAESERTGATAGMAACDRAKPKR
jgi:hypothetical protein